MARLAGSVLCAAATGCGAPLQMFSSESESAARITHLTWFVVILASVIYAIVIAFMVVALRRNRQRSPDEIDLSDPGVRPVVVGGAILPSLVLAAVFGVAETAMGKYPEPRPAFTVRVTGHQWWWELEYELPGAGGHFTAANEIHIPVGTPVRLLLTSADVIHSFWVPRLQGKLDLIPGDTNDLRLDARRAGTYRGVCEEFCGMQHANMGVVVIAEDSSAFARWVQLQANDSRVPADTTLATGQRLVVTGPCSGCHTIRGTPARGTLAPDLTHVASRATIASATLPMTLGTIEGWIANPQALKPGAKMPAATEFTGQQLRLVAEYIFSLK